VTESERRLTKTHLSDRGPLLLLPIALVGALAAGAIAAQEPLLALGAGVAALLGILVLLWPDLPTLVVLFILYSNAAVVAVQFHGLPFIIGAAVPLLLVIPLAHYLIFQREKLVFNAVVVLMIALWAIQALGTIFARRIDVALESLITFGLEGIALYFLILNTIRSTKMLRLATWAVVIAGLLLGALSFYQQLSGTFERNYGGFAQVSDAAFRTGQTSIQGEIEQPRLAGSIGEQNRYAQTMLMLFPLALFLFWGERSPWLRILAAIGALFIALGIAVTFSRGAAVSFVLLILVMTLMRYVKLYQLGLVSLGLLLTLLLVPEYGTRLASLDAFADLASSNQDFNIASADGSTRSRLTEMAAAGLAFAEHPLVGVGPGMFPYHYQEYAEQVGLRVLDARREAHSLLPGIAAEQGLSGLLIFLAIVTLTLRDLIRARRRCKRDRPLLANLATGYLLAIVAYGATGLFLHMGYIRFFWLIMALAGVAGQLALKNEGSAGVRSPAAVGDPR